MTDDWRYDANLLRRNGNEETGVLNGLEPVGWPFISRRVIVFKTWSGAVDLYIRHMSVSLLEAMMCFPHTLLVRVRERSLGEAP